MQAAPDTVTPKNESKSHLDEIETLINSAHSKVDDLISMDFQAFIDNYISDLKEAFETGPYADVVHTTRGFIPEVFQKIQSGIPLSTFIPTRYGGRGSHSKETFSVVEASSYQSLALGLTMGINGALFLQPVVRYAQEAVKQNVLTRFIEKQAMGGLMLTEPDFGSDAIHMKTNYQEKDGHFHIKGSKHWQGLTGMADFWLMTARKGSEDGKLGRQIEFFVCDDSQVEQKIEVDRLFENVGLYMIPYGHNTVDIKVPVSHKLEPIKGGIRMMMDVLHRSRLQFPAMGVGFLRRLQDEATAHCQERFVGGKPLAAYDQVQKRLSELQAYLTACTAMCVYGCENSHIDTDLSQESLTSNSIKSLLTDYMQEASQSILQLAGGHGFRLDHIAGRAIVDSRPFQIFEGSNDILYPQIAEPIIKMMRQKKEMNPFKFLKEFELTSKASDYLKDVLSFELSDNLSQRKLVDFGQIMSRVITMEFVINLSERGFRPELISSCLEQLKAEISQKLQSFHNTVANNAVDDFNEGTTWQSFLKPA